MTLTVLLLLAAAAGAAVQGLRSVADATPRGTSWLARRLAGAQFPVSPQAYLGLVAAAGAGSAALTLSLTGRGVLAVLIGCGTCAAAVWPLGRAQRSTRRHLHAQLPHLADHLADSLAVGMSLSQAVRSASETIGAPMSDQLAATRRAIELGERTESALDALAEKIDESALDVLVSAIVVQRQAGGDLSSSLSRLARELGEREKLTRELRSATAQARMTGGLVAALPIAAGVALELARPGTIGGLLQGPGALLLVATLVIQGAGILVIRRVSRVVA